MPHLFELRAVTFLNNVAPQSHGGGCIRRTDQLGFACLFSWSLCVRDDAVQRCEEALSELVDKDPGCSLYLRFYGKPCAYDLVVSADTFSRSTTARDNTMGVCKDQSKMGHRGN